MAIQYYAVGSVVLNGMLQCELAKYEFSNACNAPGGYTTRAKLTWAVPVSGPEFDPKPHVGTDTVFDLTLALWSGGRVPKDADVTKDDTVQYMRVKGKVLEMGYTGGANKEVSLWAVFGLGVEEKCAAPSST